MYECTYSTNIIIKKSETEKITNTTTKYSNGKQ